MRPLIHLLCKEVGVIADSTLIKILVGSLSYLIMSFIGTDDNYFVQLKLFVLVLIVLLKVIEISVNHD